MSDPTSEDTPRTTPQTGAPHMPSSKAAPATAEQSDMDTVELSNMQNGDTKLPLQEDIMQLARLGEILPIEKLIQEGKYTASYKDHEGITPLHWAAINNHYALCKYLIDAGADVNAIGGEAVATPTMWAVQRCNYYVVNLLLQHGADPLLTDAQGYNILHLAVFDGNVFLILLILHQNIPIDGPDPQGHTCLMWAAYKGYPAVVDLLLRWGASVNAVDEKGFTALHWSCVRGSQMCLQKLVEYGSDRFAETMDNKTPDIIASEMKATRMWHRALADCGYGPDGNPRPSTIPFSSLWKDAKSLKQCLFILPFVIMTVELVILSSKLAVFASVPIAVIFAYLAQWGMQRVLASAPPDLKHLHNTPYLAGVFAATLFWVGLHWLMWILPKTALSSPLPNVVFAIVYSACTYFYTISMIEDPGYVPKSGSRSQQKATINELLTLWKYDDQNFCVQCMLRTPLRSKHCKKCKRCVAKHDHHCPWIYNCVGANNLRHFFLYIFTLEIGIVLYIRLVLIYLKVLPEPLSSTCNILSPDICTYLLRDPLSIVLALWSALQLTWVTMLLFVQLVQIGAGRTTWESMRGHIEHASPGVQTSIAGIAAGAPSAAAASLDASGGHGHGHGHHQREGCWAQWKKLLGLDTFVATALGGDAAKKTKRGNPYSRGVVTNCRDFWCDPSPYFGRREAGQAMLDGEVVNYARMYESPPRRRRGMYVSVEGEERV